MTSRFVLIALLATAFSASLDLDPADDLNEAEFAEYFHHSDSNLSDGEKLEREEALVENQLN